MSGVARLIAFLMPLVLVGCGGGTREPVQLESEQHNRAHVAPGTNLAEKDFAATLKSSGAEYVVVSVFAADCGPCLTEALQLVDRRDKWHGERIEVLGLGMGKTMEEVRRFFKQTGDRANYPLYFAPWFAEQQLVEVTPTIFVFSADGKQLFRADGTESEDLPALVETWFKETRRKKMAKRSPQ